MNVKRAMKLLGAIFIMGAGAFLAGTSYVNVVEHLTGEPINQ